MAKKSSAEKQEQTTTPTQPFFVPFIGKTVEATDLADVESIVARDKTNQEIEVGDGNS